MGANLNISIGATVEPLKKAISGVMTLMSTFASSMGSQGVAMKAQIDAAATEINASLSQASQSFEKFGGEGDKSVKKAGGSMGSLKQQIRLAVNEAASLSQQFGMDSDAAVKAQQKAANLKEEMSDLTQRIAAMNPEAKFKALGDAAKGVSGAFGAATGAMQLLGGESEMTQQAMAKLQAIMAITQGLDAIQGLPDAFKTLKISIMGATAGMSALKVALITTGIGALIIGVGLLAANWDAVTGNADDADKKQKEVIENQKKYQEEAEAAYQKKLSNVEKEFLLSKSLYILFKDNDIEAAKRAIELATIKKKSAAEIHTLQLNELNLEVEKTKHLLDEAKNVKQLFDLRHQYNKDLSELTHKIAVENAKFEQDKIDKAGEAEEKLYNFKKEIETSRVALMSDGVAKDIANLSIKHDAEIRAATKGNQDIVSLKKIQEKESFAVMEKGVTAELELLDSANELKKANQKKASDDFRAEVEKSQAANMIDYEGIKKIGSEYKSSMMVATNWTAAQGDEMKRLQYTISAGKKALEDYAKQGIEPTDERVKQITKSLTAEEKALKKVEEQTTQGRKVAEMLNQGLQQLAVNGFTQLGVAIGNVVSGKSGLDSLFTGILLSVGEFLVKIGEGLIATALTVKAFKETMMKNPYAAVAIGVAAIILGTIMKNTISQGPSFAVGAMNVPFDMQANIHKGEMIIPKPFADDFRKGGMGGGNMQVSGLIRGRDLAILQKKNGQANLRITGRTR